MIELYAPIKSIHVASVIASGSLFLLRGLLVMAGRQPLAMWAPLRYLTYSIDTVLLAAAAILTTVVQQYPFVHGWLTMKVLLLAVYVVLGSYALKRGRSRRVRAICYGLALAVFAFTVSVARAHHPLGLLVRWTY